MNRIIEVQIADVPPAALAPCLKAAKATLDQVRTDPVLRARFILRYSQYCRYLSEDGMLPPDWPITMPAQIWREARIAKGEPATA